MFDKKATIDSIHMLLDGILDYAELGDNVPVKLGYLIELTKAKLTLETLKHKLKDCGPFGELDVLVELGLMAKEDAK